MYDPCTIRGGACSLLSPTMEDVTVRRCILLPQASGPARKLDEKKLTAPAIRVAYFQIMEYISHIKSK